MQRHSTAGDSFHMRAPRLKLPNRVAAHPRVALLVGAAMSALILALVVFAFTSQSAPVSANLPVATSAQRWSLVTLAQQIDAGDVTSVTLGRNGANGQVLKRVRSGPILLGQGYCPIRCAPIYPRPIAQRRISNARVCVARVPPPGALSCRGIDFGGATKGTRAWLIAHLRFAATVGLQSLWFWYCFPRGREFIGWREIPSGWQRRAT